MRRLCFSFSHLDAQLRWLSSSAHHNYRLGFRAQHRMRATGISDRTSTKLADDWTEALEGTPSRNKDSNGNTGHGPSRQCAPPLGNNDFAELQNPPFPKSVGSEPEMAQYGNAEMLLLSPHVIHYPSFIERGELAALLDAREEQAALFDPSPGSEAPRATAFIPTAASPVHNSGLHSAAAVNGAVEIPRAVVAATAASRAATAGTGGIGSTSVNVTEDDRCFKETATAADAVTAPPQPAIATVARSLSAGRASRCGRNTDRILVAIELGSHCTRALLHDGRSELARLTYDTMLGQNVSQQGGDSNRGEEIHPDALERTLGALQQIMAKVIASAAAVPPSPPSTVESQAAVTAMEPVEAVLPSRSVGHPHIIARMVATAAVRNASISSKAALVAAAERLTGCSLEILTGEDEGRLAWRGVVCGLQGRTQPRQHYIGAAQATTPNEAAASVCHHYNHQQQQQHLLIVDLGGRSTELVYGEVAGCALSNPIIQPCAGHCFPTFTDFHPSVLNLCRA
ncbi:hypothetical protein Vretimale_8555 [Volvox reticuliferus]|uniref:Ppx/GppA phosphatase N-terminal domain-containing protein n=1 Tax=Volvox reticuliferus TaxID=1737510 RepID=A0A8J4GBM6_9CHLO|nr:hypothetical protein Vretimale_8555 [Volvox reticuliferus]